MLAAGPGFLFVDEARTVRELAQFEAGCSDVRMNDGDPQGRFCAGTMAYDESPGAGALYRLELDGSCWWGGGAVKRYDPDGSLLLRVPLPAQPPTSCAFGGPDRTTLFVTTARAGLDEAARTRQPDSGRVFAIDGLGVRALPCKPYRGQV